MPKIKYYSSDWAIPKNCGYCGKQFYPINNESFCDYDCETSHNDYMDWYDWQLVEDMLKNEDL